MMQLYPAHAADALEFTKIKELLHLKCRTDGAHQRVSALKFQTKLAVIERSLLQTEEFKQILESGDAFPNDFTANAEKELQLLRVPNAVLSGEQLLLLQRLSLNTSDILRWFKRHPDLFSNLGSIVEKTVYEKEIAVIVEATVDSLGAVKDEASRALRQIRTDLNHQRHELRRTFESVLRKLSKLGYLADIAEGFLNGRRTVAVLAEHKRIVKGILHGESDSSRTVFIEPAEVVELNNEIFSLEREEAREIHRILAKTTAELAPYQPVLEHYYTLAGLYDFIRAKALLARDMNAGLPRLTRHPTVDLRNAFHPLLLLHNRAAGKPTVPTTLALDRKQRLLIISGPNAGGKTVTMKTVGLLQLMVQAGLLIPADSESEVGIFQQLMIHIGDTQSIEHELSTYSAHLRDMKYFLEFANGKTLFFIDELGSGSDPNLGGAFAEAIVEELAHKHAMGIITTHYLNLKVMAGKVRGIVNGAMAFDELRLEPLYQLILGKPGSSYTFAIAQRTGLSDKIIQRAREITDRGHFRLDKMLLQTEKQGIRLTEKEKKLNTLLKENEQLKKNLEQLTDKEKLQQHYNTLKLQNKIKKEELDYLRDMERKFKQIIHDWKKSENKHEVIQAAEKVLFRKKQIESNQSAARKADKHYEVVGGEAKVGDLVRNQINHQIGTLESFRDKRAIVRIGHMPFNVNLEDWIVVKKKEHHGKGNQSKE